MQLDLSNVIRGVKVGEVALLFDVDATAVKKIRFHTALDGTPDFDRSDIVEYGVEPQRGATPHAGRGAQAKGNARSDIGMGVEEAFVGHLGAADNEAGALEISLETAREIAVFCARS